ncbi:MAG: sodium:proton antiporter [Gammaproteobacteria bacterium]|nr:sodium:proton antiporter [Gammaproteobacteria bacterium]
MSRACRLRHHYGTVRVIASYFLVKLAVSEQHVTLLLVAIIATGVGVQWLAYRWRMPAIVLLVLAGLVIGPFTGWLEPEALLGETFRPFVSLCVAVILFEGGLNLHFHELKVAASGVKRLVYVGAPLAWVLASLAAHFVGGLAWPVSLVFGAIMVVTGPTVIMPMLRQAQLNRRTASYFKWEGIVNDPIGALLAVLVFQYFVFASEQGSGLGALVSGVGWALVSGALLGGFGGWLTAQALQRGWIPEYLKSPVLLSLVLVVYELSNLLQHEAGLLAVTIMGLVIGNTQLPGIHDMKRFKEYITVMLVAVVFVLLTADLDIGQWSQLNWRGIALLVMILFIVRPATVLLATYKADMDWRDRVLLAWIAPRGIVAAATAGVMGPRMVEAGYEGAEKLLPLVFAVILLTVVLHGMTLGPIARRMQLSSGRRDRVLIVGASPWSIELAQKLQEIEVDVLLADSSWHNLRAARVAGVPVFYGDILSSFAEESVETGQIGLVLSATSNDAYNALVCTSLAPEIGRSHTFQLPMGAAAEDDPRGVARARRGTIAFNTDALFEKLWRNHVRGWKFYRTNISEEYSYSDFLGKASAEAFPILLVKSNGTIIMQSAQAPFEPANGDSLLYYAPKRAE